MPNREMVSDLKGTPALTAQTISSDATTAGTEIDLQGYDSATFFITSATITDGTFTPLITEATVSGGTFTAVADADLTATEASIAFVAADDNVTKKIGYTGSNRFIKLSLVSTGTTSGGALSALAVLGHPSNAPVA